MNLKLRYTYRLFFLLLVILTGFFTVAYAQKHMANVPVKEQHFDESQWEETIEGIDYSADQPKKKKEPKEYNDPDFNLDFLDEWGGFLLKLIALITIITFTVILLVNLVGSDVLKRPTNTAVQEEIGHIDIDQLEEKIMETDLEQLMLQATQQQQYALSIRLYYLQIIKELSQRQLIKWKPDKTNRIYANELLGSPYYATFRSLTQTFEKAWYGRHPFTRENYQTAKPAFDSFLEQVRQHQAAL